MIGTDCTCSCKSNYHTITTTTVPKQFETGFLLISVFYGKILVGIPASIFVKSGCHDIAEILLIVALKQTFNNQFHFTNSVNTNCILMFEKWNQKSKNLQ